MKKTALADLDVQAADDALQKSSSLHLTKQISAFVLGQSAGGLRAARCIIAEPKRQIRYSLDFC
ncbi:hypothetical protein C4F40_04785 [Sphingobacterium sp. Ka21]|uniref:Alpha/beta hydrolase n=1 Tax=Sphingobacterium pedocola TaxID=2082722 RepID=A0ABR9T3W8_9SPHI|nr:hypothetical protein [Sphingobacterium pedocola]